MHPFRILLLLFLTVPLLEIYLLIKLGSLIGALPTILLEVFTALLGAVLVRMQGFATLQRVQSMLARGEIPAVEMLEGVVLLLSGALLLTPGLFTDTVGFLCLVPSLRRRVILWLLEHSLLGGGRPPGPPPGGHGPRTIEGEFWRDRGDDARR
ncbi:MAG TPA: FxsA family protein [Gammaproteobacteria bacterium]|nr:FxsA family protein [Gammaproteobacteria bacterium]